MGLEAGEGGYEEGEEEEKISHTVIFLKSAPGALEIEI